MATRFQKVLVKKVEKKSFEKDSKKIDFLKVLCTFEMELSCKLKLEQILREAEKTGKTINVCLEIGEKGLRIVDA